VAFWVGLLQAGVECCRRSCTVLAVERLGEQAAALEEQLIARLEVAITDCHTQKIRISDIAAQLHMSVRTLQNICQRHYGEPPLKVLRGFRLQRLCLAMQEQPWKPLRTLFEQCGLVGGVADRDQFMEMFGITIAEYQHVCRSKSMLKPQFQSKPKACLQLSA
jgi:AraC-like DNA-binding protein